MKEIALSALSGNYPNGTYVVSRTWYFFRILEFSCHTALLTLLIGFASCLSVKCLALLFVDFVSYL